MNDKEWLDKVVAGCKIYNDDRIHTDFQEEEVLKFVEWLHKQYGIEYVKPKAIHQNTPEKLEHLKATKNVSI
jgi:hypothetical protein